MKVGVVFPQLESGVDPIALRDYAQTLEGVGYTHILAYDHVLGADTSLPERQGWTRYKLEDQFHEPFVLFSYLAGVTSRIEFIPGVIVLPQRQTALVAKQAAEVDVLSGGRFRLGVGAGWNEVEFEALNENFRNRGKREEEQIEVMRLLWTQESVSYQGRWHTITAAGIRPLPTQRPIPVWVGGSTDPAFKRAARIGDGWLPQFRPDARAAEIVERVRAYTREAGRDPAALGMEARLTLTLTPRDEWRQDLGAWRDLGATHIGINTMGYGLRSFREHIELLERLYDELGIADFNGR